MVNRDFDQSKYIHYYYIQLTTQIIMSKITLKVELEIVNYTSTHHEFPPKKSRMLLKMSNIHPPKV